MPALKKEGDQEGAQAASRNGEKQGNRLSPRASGKEVALQTDACFQPSQTISDSDLQNGERSVCCVQPLCWWSFIPMAREHQ